MTPSLQAQIEARKAVLERLKQILIEDLYVTRAPDTIDLDAPLFAAGLGLDSVDALELVVASETAFGIALPEDVLRASLRTLNTLADAVLLQVSA